MVQQKNRQQSKEWKEIPLSEALDYEQPNNYIVNEKILEKETSIPVLTPGKSFIKGYTKETEGIYKNVPVIIFDDFTTSIKYVDFPFKVKSSAMKILKPKNSSINLKYVYYQMLLKEVNTTTHKRYYLSTYQKLKFLFPIDNEGNINFDEQEHIVKEIESKISILENVEQVLKRSLSKSDLLRKSVLNFYFKNKK